MWILINSKCSETCLPIFLITDRFFISNKCTPRTNQTLVSPLMEGGKKQNTGKRTERTTLEDEEPFAICYDNFGSYPSSLRLRSRVHPATQRSQDGRGIRKQLWVSFEELKTDLQNMPLVVLCEKYCLDKSQAGLRVRDFFFPPLLDYYAMKMHSWNAFIPTILI